MASRDAIHALLTQVAVVAIGAWLAMGALQARRDPLLGRLRAAGARLEAFVLTRKARNGTCTSPAADLSSGGMKRSFALISLFLLPVLAFGEAEKAVAKKVRLKTNLGSIAMARTSDPDSATSQFFINVADNAMLDFPNNGGYAAFGKVVEGMDVVDKIKSTATGTSTLTMRHPASGHKIQMPATDVPKQAVVIQSASAE
jgi:cyclophilin family peptidyl-prolyl cis-trans isomerase